MAQGARVESLDVIRSFRAALCKFAETANVALGDADSDVQRTMMWLELEQDSFWQGEIRKRIEAVGRAKEAVRMKKVFKDSAGRTPSAVDEEKALAVAMRRVAEAEQKLVAVRKSVRKLEKEAATYKGSVGQFLLVIQADIPVALARLDSKLTALEAYVALQAPAVQMPATAAPTAVLPAESDAATGSMARPEPVEEPPDKPAADAGATAR